MLPLSTTSRIIKRAYSLARASDNNDDAAAPYLSGRFLTLPALARNPEMQCAAAAAAYIEAASGKVITRHRARAVWQV